MRVSFGVWGFMRISAFSTRESMLLVVLFVVCVVFIGSGWWLLERARSLTFSVCFVFCWGGGSSFGVWWLRFQGLGFLCFMKFHV